MPLRRLAQRDRIMVAFVAVFDVFVGIQMVAFSDALDIPGHQLWPWWFIAAGVATVLYVAAFDSSTAMALAGAMTVTAYASRALAVLVAVEQHRLDISDARARVGVAEWALLALFAAWFWLFVLKTRMAYRARR